MAETIEGAKFRMRWLEFSPAGRSDGKRAKVLQVSWWDGQREVKSKARPDAGWTAWENVPVVDGGITMTMPRGAEVVNG